MDTLATLFHPGVAWPLLLFSVWLGASFWAGEITDDRLTGIPVSHALFVWLGKPFLRVIGMLVFLSLSYPQLFGQTDLLNTDLGFDPANRFHSLLNSLFLVSLVLPQLPMLARHHGPILLLQLMIACGLIFRWQFEHAGLDLTGLSLLPDPLTLALIFGLSLLMHGVTRMLSQTIGHWVARHRHILHADQVAQETLCVLLQSPSLVIYTLFLGRQLPAISA